MSTETSSSETDQKTLAEMSAGNPSTSNKVTPSALAEHSSISQNSAPNVVVEHVLDVPKMWTGRGLLPSYFITLENYFDARNIVDENARFVSLSNVMSPKQIETHIFE